MYILGINISHHCSICLLKDGEIVFFLEEERLSKIKQHYPRLFLRYAWDNLSSGIYDDIRKEMALKSLGKIRHDIKEIDHVIFCSTGESSDTAVKNYIMDQLRESFSISSIHHYPEHHLYHACSAFYSSGFDRAVAVVLDGGGFSDKHQEMIEISDRCDSAFHEQESVYMMDYRRVRSIFKHYAINSFKIGKREFPITRLPLDSGPGEKLFSDSFSCGGIFNLISHVLGFDGSSAGKTMGLAAYGDEKKVSESWFSHDSETDSSLTDGSAILSSLSKRFYLPNNLDDLWQPDGVAKVNEKVGADLAKKAQVETLDHTIRLIEKYTEKTGEKNVVLSGGYFLNCSNNYEYLKRFPDLRFFVDPIAHDGGTALGAAKYLWHELTGDTIARRLETLYLGV